MAEDGRADELREAERRLQAAQLAADADELERLLDDRLVFTGPDGLLYSKQDDLEIQRSGAQALTEVSEEELAVLVEGRLGVTWFLGTLAGVLKGSAFTARVRYTRTWVHTDEHGWRLLAAHVSSV
ncbi:nuclear transport factor 2 family protein [Frankia sp. CNm7]|uniref:Nuclear transport factor 2 family protein n=1 Tax=Frankia nepalensis TaxID=1836974 RepID=A0A937RDI2_9ACTN|nr:nuclear transport factor 2 family protein [Frankia nepalensis]MBL7498139.1 nuclear transport factor 2 family protein [Frankia nepalensis]MBL7509343.1 nuclear transport factor 2 family protein [Frankia nepalensis]MBL7516869.1 nuclear transport factor 2 family protein [Frankia nepalensis]MBL7627927.1 nuclear transport factor 2 family protein [Frankia nepalensis]